MLGPLKWLKDKLLGMPSEVNAFYEAGKRQFVADMDRVTGLVATGLTEAKTMIATHPCSRYSVTLLTLERTDEALTQL